MCRGGSVEAAARNGAIREFGFLVLSADMVAVLAEYPKCVGVEAYEKQRIVRGVVVPSVRVVGRYVIVDLSRGLLQTNTVF